MTTGIEVPDREVTETLGVIYGLVVRSMGAIGGVVAGVKALRRGEVSQYTQLLEDSRRHAIDRMVENARLVRWADRCPLRLLGDRPAAHRDRRLRHRGEARATRLRVRALRRVARRP
jgi:hypothetical protein